MASVLVDTSVWVDYFRKGESPAALLLDLLIKEKMAVLCGIVELELLQGVRPSEKEPLQELLTALPYVETERTDFQKAGDLLRELKAKGVQIPATDGMIAALCVRHRLSLLTLDKHFDHFPDVKKINIDDHHWKAMQEEAAPYALAKGVRTEQDVEKLIRKNRNPKRPS